jgi:hypothetical protein
MHIDRLHLRLAGRRRSTALARFDPAICHARLRELAVALDGQPWMVVSGLVEPLTNGGFTRAHSDIDIAIPRDNLEAAAVAALRAGFVLTTRVLRTHLNSSAARRSSVRDASGALISLRNFLVNAAHLASVSACSPSFSVAGLGESTGYPTSY